MKDLIIKLRDRDSDLVKLWEEHFPEVDNIEISHGDIFDNITADAIISPANSFGFMGAGINLIYSKYFGWDLQNQLKECIEEYFHGELLVGQATILPTGNKKIPFLISAPTMRVPTDVSNTINAYLAFRAALLAIQDYNMYCSEPIKSVICPGLATAIGRMPYKRCAVQMVEAYNEIVLDCKKSIRYLKEETIRNYRLRTV